MVSENIFILDTSAIKVGPGAIAELGYEADRLGMRRVMMVTDADVASLDFFRGAVANLESAGLSVEVYSDVEIEPTDNSLRSAIAAADQGEFDGFVSIGGGSSIDTAKVANLYTSWPAEFLTYVNQPIGRGEPVPGPLRPHIAVPTTAGTGSETTGVAIFDYAELSAKTGIAHRALRPTIGIIDPAATATLPPLVAAASGLDVLSHALESLTAIPFDRRAAPISAAHRPAYQGANPISDIWSTAAITAVSKNIIRAIEDPGNESARLQMMLAAAYAGIGFGNAGVHLPHGMSYPVSGMVRNYYPAGYPSTKAIIPHGISVILNSPAVFRWTAESDPARHLRAARLLGFSAREDDLANAGEILAEQIINLMRRLDLPSGLAAIGFTDCDIPDLVAGTLPQHRVTKLSPRPADNGDLSQLFAAAMRYW